jgi:hypothetical protein
MPLSAEELLAIARNYWRPDKELGSSLETSPEAQRLQALWEQELKRIDQWFAFLEDLERELPGFSIGDATATCDASFRCAAYPETNPSSPRFRWAVVGCVSILAPVYTVYGVRYDYRGPERVGAKLFFELLPSELRVAADRIGGRIEATFGASALPWTVAQRSISLFVDPLEPPDTTLFHALFTAQPASVP